MAKHFWMSFDFEAVWAWNGLSVHSYFIQNVYFLSKQGWFFFFVLCGIWFIHEPTPQPSFPVLPALVSSEATGTGMSRQEGWEVRLRTHLSSACPHSGFKSLIFLKFCNVVSCVHKQAPLASAVLPRPCVLKFPAWCCTTYSSQAKNIDTCVCLPSDSIPFPPDFSTENWDLAIYMHLFKRMLSLACHPNSLITCSHYCLTDVMPVKVVHGREKVKKTWLICCRTAQKCKTVLCVKAWKAYTQTHILIILFKCAL